MSERGPLTAAIPDYQGYSWFRVVHGVLLCGSSMNCMLQQKSSEAWFLSILPPRG